MKNYLIPICLLLFLSCKEDKPQEVMDLEELTGETGAEESNDTIEINSANSTPSDMNDFVKSQLSFYDTISHITPHSIDRFGFGSKQKIEFKGKVSIVDSKLNSVIPVARFFYYTFSDTIKTNNALYNWLDCFGTDCNVIKLNEDVDQLTSAPMFTLVYDTCIVAVEYVCGQEKNNWRAFQDSLISKFGNDYKYRIDVKCGGPLKWKQPLKH